MSSQKNETTDSSRKPFRYFVVAYGCLLLGSFFIGADGALFQVGLAASLFLVFLGIRSLPRIKTFNKGRSETRYTPPAPPPYQSRKQESKSPGINEIFESIKKSIEKSQAGKDPSKRINPATIFTFAFLGFLVFFFVIVFSIIDSDDDFSQEQFIVQTGDDYYNLGQYDSAYRYYKISLMLEPESQSAYRGLGNVKLAQEQYDSAMIYFDEALVRDPDDYVSRNGRALCYFFRKQYNESLNDSKYILARTDNFVDAFLMAADCFYAKELYDSAIAYYEPGYELGARSALLSHRMAYIYDMRGNIDKAIPFYEEAVSYDTTIVDIYRRLTEITTGDKQASYFKKIQQF